MMPAGAGANPNLLSMLECDVCNEYYNKAEQIPRQLPCQHTYCTRCLARIMTTSTVCCPQCRQEHTINGTDVTSIPKSRTHCDLLDLLSKEMNTHSVETPLCVFCEEDHVVSFCDTCTKSMCETCVAAHKKQKDTRQHTVRNLNTENKTPGNSHVRVVALMNGTANQNGSGDKRARVYAKCSQPGHATQDVVQFCRGCRTVVCSKCLTEEHRGHTCESLTDALKSCEDKIYEELGRIQDGSEGNSIRHICANVARDRSSIIEFLHQRVQELYASYMNVLGNAKENQLEKLKQYSDTLTRELNEIKARFDSIISRLEAWKQQANGQIRGDIAQRIQSGFAAMKQLEELEEQLSGTRDRYVRYSMACTTEDFRTIVGALGTVKTYILGFNESPPTLSTLRQESGGNESLVYMDGSSLLNVFHSLTLHCQPESSLSHKCDAGTGDTSSVTYKKVVNGNTASTLPSDDATANTKPISDKDAKYSSIQNHGHDVVYSTCKTNEIICDRNTEGAHDGHTEMTATLRKSVPPAVRQALSSAHIANTAKARLGLRNLGCIWCIEGGDLVVSSRSEEHAKRCLETLEQSVEQRVVKFRKESRNVVESDKLIAFREMVTARFYDIAWLSAEPNKDEMLVCATCSPVLDDVSSMVRRFLADNVVKTVRLTYPDNLVTMVAKHVATLDKIKASLSQFAVWIEVRGASLVVRGVGVGLAVACRQVERLVRKIAARQSDGQDRFDSADEDDSDDETRFEENEEGAVSTKGPQCASMQLLTNTAETAVGAVCFAGDDVIIYVVTGNIIALPVEAVVSPADEKLKHTGGLAKALVNAGGPIIQDECTSQVHQHGALHPGDVFCSGAGSLPFAAIMHAVSCKWSQGPEIAKAKLSSAVTKALTEASSRGISSVAMPALGSGAYKVPVEVSTEVTVQSVKAFMTREPHGAVREIYLCDVEADTARHFIAALQTAYTEEDILITANAHISLQQHNIATETRGLLLM